MKMVPKLSPTLERRSPTTPDRGTCLGVFLDRTRQRSVSGLMEWHALDILNVQTRIIFDGSRDRENHRRGLSWHLCQRYFATSKLRAFGDLKARPFGQSRTTTVRGSVSFFTINDFQNREELRAASRH